MTESPRPPEDLPAFDPVPSASTRHDGWTPERQRRFIAALAEMGVVAAAARAVGKSATGAYALRDKSGAAGFAAAWDIAQDMGRDRQYEGAMERATKGYEVPRYYAGRQVGIMRRFDCRLALAALRSMDTQPLPASEADLAMARWLLSGAAGAAPE